MTLVDIKLETGRHHQIRVQFASRKHPLAGDGKYGSRIKSDVSLFAAVLEYKNPSDGKVQRFFEDAPVGSPWNLFPEEVKKSVRDLSL